MNAFIWTGALCLVACAVTVSAGEPVAVSRSSPDYRYMQLAEVGARATVEEAQPAQAPNDSDPEMGAILQRLIAWIADNTHYSPPKPPRVVFEDEESLAKRFYGGVPTDDEPLQVKALYDHASGTVLLCDCWDVDDVFDQSVLLHELVHHVQRHNRTVSQCRAALEAEPYKLQAKWLAEQGVPRPYEAMGTDRFTIDVLSTCPD